MMYLSMVVLGLVNLSPIGSFNFSASDSKPLLIAETAKPLTFSSPLGLISLDNSVSSASQSADGISGTKYTSRKLHFTITWPDQLNWNVSESVASQYNLPADVNVPLGLFFNEPVSNFRPNVIVTVTPKGNLSFRDHLNGAIIQLKQAGWKVTGVEVNGSSNGAVLVVNNDRVAQVMRLVTFNDLVYNTTASYVSSELSANVRKGLHSILNSFILLK